MFKLASEFQQNQKNKPESQFNSLPISQITKEGKGKYSGLGVDKERKISSRDKRDNRIQGVMDRGQSLAEES